MKFFITCLLFLTLTQHSFSADEVKPEDKSPAVDVKGAADPSLPEETSGQISLTSEKHEDVSIPDVLDTLDSNHDHSRVRESLSLYFFVFSGIILFVLTLASVIPPRTSSEKP